MKFNYNISNKSKRTLTRLLSQAIIVKLRQNTSKLVNISLASLAIAGVAYAIKKNYKSVLSKFQNNTELSQNDDDDTLSIDDDAKIRYLYAKYSNKVEYIDVQRVENLVSYARFKHALTYIKLANLTKKPINRDRAINELTKLSQINDGLTQIIQQLIQDNTDLLLQISSNPKIDNRFLPNESPSIHQNLIKFNSTHKKSIDNDDEFNFIFDFCIKKLNNLNAYIKKINDLKLKFYLKKFYATINELLMQDYKFKGSYHQLGLNDLFLHDIDGNDLLSNIHVSDSASSISGSSSDGKAKIIKDENIDAHKLTKKEYLLKLEYIILQILDSYVKYDQNEFIKFGGLDMLLILYEKNKLNDEFLIPIFDILSIITSSNHDCFSLFIQSGWLKRIHELIIKLNTNLNHVHLARMLFMNKLSLENYYQLIEKQLILQLIVYKILFNLKTAYYQKTSTQRYYSNMIYQLYPLKCDKINLNLDLLAFNDQFSDDTFDSLRGRGGVSSEANNDDETENSIDVIFIHGLLGSVFKSWRQDDHHINELFRLMDKVKPVTDEPVELIDKIKFILDNSSKILPNLFNYINYTHCWPKNWLAHDFSSVNIYGINYNSILSYWNGNIDEFANISEHNTIKMRSNEIIKQLDLAKIGNKPIIWVCHSMGGLILKEILLCLANYSRASSTSSSILNNTKGIIFYSTPHLGSALAKRATSLSLATWPSKEIKDLALNNTYLINLNDQFINLSRLNKWKIISFCENQSTNVGYNLYIRLVSENSARLPADLGDFYVLNKDHMYICKPDTKESIIYKSLFNLIDEINSQLLIEKQFNKRNNSIKKRKNYFYKQFSFD